MHVCSNILMYHSGTEKKLYKFKSALHKMQRPQSIKGLKSSTPFTLKHMYTIINNLLNIINNLLNANL